MLRASISGWPCVGHFRSAPPPPSSPQRAADRRRRHKGAPPPPPPPPGDSDGNKKKKTKKQRSGGGGDGDDFLLHCLLGRLRSLVHRHLTWPCTRSPQVGPAAIEADILPLLPKGAATAAAAAAGEATN